MYNDHHHSIQNHYHHVGYGSAVFKQGDDVDQHEDHYQYRTNRMTDLLSPNIGTLHPGGLYCKYGIISHDDLCDDLNNWKSLYVGGRLHKPVEDVYISDKKACSLSYMGDIRSGMIRAEDPNKVYNIVHGQANELIHIYSPILLECGVKMVKTTILKIPNNKNKDAATFHDNDPYYNGQSGLSDDNEEEEEEGAPIVVDQWGNSLRPLRADDLKHIEEKPQEASAAVVLDEAVENDKKKNKQHVKLEHTKTTAHDNVPRIKEECNINDDDDKEEEEEERYDSDEDSDQSVVRGDEKVDEPRIKKEVDNNEDGDQSPIRKGVVRMSSGFTAGLVTGEDISKQMEEPQRDKVEVEDYRVKAWAATYINAEWIDLEER
ncbi:conserved hypothetical protein [Perkinsus marinus ATCC 50983]|uniref:Phosphatidate cytidylyltransferase, mitochondrial n=1 Tax=Perkinsus marinus (strain ATCC 50983 / TXsc) TaxID=423536 RepID=C5KDK3_PERM5|nr:conserved hypothetical protein [Perkinsus marinus ATCC 50983]EER17306.1 conserved hypothetical protein [Perkinsus marinus ATCC 50983]|eukprot:XP_002785510.1 conserved hypothetical protein [Perkinsus marinus ATCC 50983]